MRRIRNLMQTQFRKKVRTSLIGRVKYGRNPSGDLPGNGSHQASEAWILDQPWKVTHLGKNSRSVSIGRVKYRWNPNWDLSGNGSHQVLEVWTSDQLSGMERSIFAILNTVRKVFSMCSDLVYSSADRLSQIYWIMTSGVWNKKNGRTDQTPGGLGDLRYPARRRKQPRFKQILGMLWSIRQANTFDRNLGFPGEGPEWTQLITTNISAWSSFVKAVEQEDQWQGGIGNFHSRT